MAKTSPGQKLRLRYQTAINFCDRYDLPLMREQLLKLYLADFPEDFSSKEVTA